MTTGHRRWLDRIEHRERAEFNARHRRAHPGIACTPDDGHLWIQDAVTGNCWECFAPIYDHPPVSRVRNAAVTGA